MISNRPILFVFEPPVRERDALYTPQKHEEQVIQLLANNKRSEIMVGDNLIKITPSYSFARSYHGPSDVGIDVSRSYEIISVGTVAWVEKWLLEGAARYPVIQPRDWKKMVNRTSVRPEYWPAWIDQEKYIGRIIGALNCKTPKRVKAIEQRNCLTLARSLFRDLKGGDLWIKPYNQYKQWETKVISGKSEEALFIGLLENIEIHPFVYNGSINPPEGESMINSHEFRYYFLNGELLLGGYWYKRGAGDLREDEEMPNAPKLPEDLLGAARSARWSGAMDIMVWRNDETGEMDKGLTVIECHHPFACGYYGPANNYSMDFGPGGAVDRYVKWLVEGYREMKKHSRS